MEKSSTLATLGEQDHPYIVLLPVCDDSIAAFHDGRAFSLPIALPASQKAAESEVSRLVTTMGAPEDLVISHVSSRGSVELWRADMPAVGGPFGRCGKHDLFLQQVDEGVKGIDKGAWRDFFRNAEGFLCYQRDGDAVPRICVPKVSRNTILHAAHGGALVGHPGITRTEANIAQFFWWPNLFRDVSHFVRSCRTCATAKSFSGLRLGVDAFSSVPIQTFTHWSMDLIGPLPKSRQTLIGRGWIVPPN